MELEAKRNKKNAKNSALKMVTKSQNKNYEGERALTGAQAMANAMRQINPDVVAAYPITPQTPIMEQFAKFVADGIVDTELIRVESEHSAMSATMGASASGARAMTATSSVGLALMFEVVNAAAGLRLPIVMGVANRALSSPINIHCDHSDTMACRDAGWIQFYSENAQEVYENALLAMRLSEMFNVPSMVIQDGFITSHCVTNVSLLKDSVVKRYVGTYKPKDSLFFNKSPLSIGALELFDYFFETKRQQEDAMEQVYKNYNKIASSLSEITGKKYPMVENYYASRADVVIVTLNSTAGTVKEVVDKYRRSGKNVGLLKIRLFRPFPYNEVRKLLKNVKAIAVLDRSFSFGADAPIFGEIKNALFDLDKKPKLFSYIFGLGGRSIYERDVAKVFDDLLNNKKLKDKNYIGLRE